MASEIFDHNAKALADMTFVGERFYRERYRLVLSGGIFRTFPEYAEAVRSMGSPLADMIRAEVPPVFGCAIENLMYDAGFDIDAFREVFMKDYARVCGKQ